VQGGHHWGCFDGHCGGISKGGADVGGFHSVPRRIRRGWGLFSVSRSDKKLPLEERHSRGPSECFGGQAERDV